MSLTDLIDSIEDPNPTPSRKIVLLSGDDLLTEAIGLFLVESGSWDVIRVSNDKGVVKLIQEATRIKPDVVILCQDRVGGEAVLPMRLIGAHLCPRVVTLSLESNLMQVYSKHDFMLQGASELLSIIESRNFLNCKSGKEVKG